MAILIIYVVNVQTGSHGHWRQRYLNLALGLGPYHTQCYRDQLAMLYPDLNPIMSRIRGIASHFDVL